MANLDLLATLYMNKGHINKKEKPPTYLGALRKCQKCLNS